MKRKLKDMENGILIKLKSDFLVVKETLERIGICNKNTKVITPSCYILHKQGNYYLIHFKFLLALDGFKKEVEERDILRQNAIATLLQNWGMIEIMDKDVYQETLMEKIFVLPFKDKVEYTINHKYKISKRNK